MGRVKLAAAAAIMLVGLAPAPGFAAESDYHEVQRLELSKTIGTITPWSAVVFQSKVFEKAIADGLFGPDQGVEFDVPVRICFVQGAIQPRNCFEARTTDPRSGLIYVEQLSQQLSTISLTPGRDGLRGVQLRTLAYGTSGGEVGTRIWRYVPGSDSFALVSTFLGSDISEIEMLDGDFDQSFLVMSDFIWGEGESHFAPHRFRIEVKRYVADGRFEPVLDYVTDAQYPITDGDQVVAHVIKFELDTIRTKIHAAHPE